MIALSSLDLLRFFKSVYSDDVKFKILECLAVREAVGLRELARVAGFHHTALYRHLNKLISCGVVEQVKVSKNMSIYRLSGRYGFLRELFRQV